LHKADLCELALWQVSECTSRSNERKQVGANFRYWPIALITILSPNDLYCRMTAITPTVSCCSIEVSDFQKLTIGIQSIVIFIEVANTMPCSMYSMVVTEQLTQLIPPFFTFSSAKPITSSNPK
jgi:hypothetical protein